MNADNEIKPEPAIVFECGPKLTCPDGSEHDYSKWEQDGQCETAVCSKCGHRAIDAAIKQREQDTKDAALLKWAVSRWNAEVLHRPLVNVHRRTLDDTWRQVIRHAGGDDVVILGPRHDALVAMAKGPGND